MKQYFQIIKSHPILSAEEEREALIKAKAGCKKHANKLVLHNLSFAISLAKNAKRTRKTCVDIEEIMEVAIIGLFEAVRRFRADQIGKVKFITAAYPSVQKEIYDVIRNNRFRVYVPPAAYKKYLKVATLLKHDNLEHDVSTILSQFTLKKEEVMMAQAVQRAHYVPSLESKDVLDYRTREFQLESDKDILCNLIKKAKLNCKEWHLVVVRNGLFGCQSRTQRQTAKLFTMCSTACRELESNILERLKKEANERSSFVGANSTRVKG